MSSEEKESSPSDERGVQEAVGDWKQNCSDGEPSTDPPVSAVRRLKCFLTADLHPSDFFVTRATHILNKRQKLFCHPPSALDDGWRLSGFGSPRVTVC